MNNDYELFTSQFHSLTGIDLSLYKESQMKRRLIAFYQSKGYSSFSSLMVDLKKNKVLLDSFLSHMTINVTEFFRDESRWTVLEEKIVKPLVQQKKKIKVWSAACSTGQEPYSLSMLLSKYLKPEQYSILATDLDKEVLQIAKKGEYPPHLVSKLPDTYKKHFRQNGNLFTIDSSIQKPVTFKQHNLMKDVYGSDFDLIVCRNVLIYFNDEAKNEVFHKFSRSLSSGGTLFIGSTEQIFKPEIFNLTSKETFFFTKK